MITFQAKAENIFAAEAVGLVIHNNVFGPFQGVLVTQPDFPVISISRNDGEAIEDLLADSEIEASITLTTKDLPSQNVIAEKKGPSESVVVRDIIQSAVTCNKLKCRVIYLLRRIAGKGRP